MEFATVAQVVISLLLGLVSYFLKQLHEELKHLIKAVNLEARENAVRDEKIKQLDLRMSVLEKKD